MSSGKIVQIIGAVVDVKFPYSAVPNVFNELKVIEGDLKGLTLEVQQKIGGGIVRTIAIGSTKNLSLDIAIEDLGKPINKPVRIELINNIMKSLSKPIK